MSGIRKSSMQLAVGSLQFAVKEKNSCQISDIRKNKGRKNKSSRQKETKD